MSTRKIILLVGNGVAVVALVWVGLYYCLGVWPPDIGSTKASLLASAESVTGERFKVVQFWGSDFYMMRLEHISPDGTEHIAVIDGDDKKQWSCSAQVIEPEKKLVVRFSDGSPPIEYLWEKKWFATLPGWQRIRE